MTGLNDDEEFSYASEKDLWMSELGIATMLQSVQRVEGDNGEGHDRRLVGTVAADNTSISHAIASLAFVHTLSHRFSLVSDNLHLMCRLNDDHEVTCLQKPDWRYFLAIRGE